MAYDTGRADVRGKMGRIFSCVIAFAFGVSGVRAQVFGFAAEGVSSGKASENVVVATGTNGFFDIDFGVRYDLGRNLFYKI